MKKLLTVLVILVALYLGLCAVLPNQFDVTREVTVEAPVDVVFNQVGVLKNWEAWSPWAAMDSTMNTTYSGAEAGVGQMSAWTSENSGSGKMEFIEMKENEMLRTSIDFGAQGMAAGLWKFKEVEKGTKVSWNVKGDLGFFMRPMGLMMDGMLGGQFEMGLEQMKEIAESMPAVPSYEISTTLMPAVMFLSVSDSCAVEEIGDRLGVNYGAIIGHLGSIDAEMAGMPFAIFHSFDYVNTSFESCIPVAAEVAGSDNVEFKSLEAYAAITATHVGGYNTSTAHEAMAAYAEANGITIGDAPLEFYMNDPEEVGMDNAETLVVYPIISTEE